MLAAGRQARFVYSCNYSFTGQGNGVQEIGKTTRKACALPISLAIPKARQGLAYTMPAMKRPLSY